MKLKMETDIWHQKLPLFNALNLMMIRLNIMLGMKSIIISMMTCWPAHRNTIGRLGWILGSWGTRARAFDIVQSEFHKHTIISTAEYT